MDNEYNIKITDFGISRKLIENSIKYDYSNSIKDIIPFLSPEMKDKYD